MIASTRSRVLLLGSALAPVTVVLFRFSHLRAMAAAEVRGGMLVSYDPGLLPIGMVLVGILCFVAGLVSLFVDFRSGR